MLQYWQKRTIERNLRGTTMERLALALDDVASYLAARNTSNP
jgi:hypothetical protein